MQRTQQRRKRNHAQDTRTCKACTDPASQRPRSTAFSLTSSQERGLHSAQETRQRLYTCTVKSTLSRAGFAVELFTAWRSASGASHLQAGTPPKSVASADPCGQKKGNCTRVQFLKSLLSKQSCREIVKGVSKVVNCLSKNIFFFGGGVGGGGDDVDLLFTSVRLILCHK